MKTEIVLKFILATAILATFSALIGLWCVFKIISVENGTKSVLTALAGFQTKQTNFDQTASDKIGELFDYVNSHPWNKK